MRSTQTMCSKDRWRGWSGHDVSTWVEVRLVARRLRVPPDALTLGVEALLFVLVKHPFLDERAVVCVVRKADADDVIDAREVVCARPVLTADEHMGVRQTCAGWEFHD